jgi:hypothetical protein
MNDHNQSKEIWLYSGLALGVLAGAAAATYFLTRRNGEFGMASASPTERAEQLIESCESKLDSIERAISELKESR